MWLIGCRNVNRKQQASASSYIFLSSFLTSAFTFSHNDSLGASLPGLAENTHPSDDAARRCRRARSKQRRACRAWFIQHLHLRDGVVGHGRAAVPFQFSVEALAQDRTNSPTDSSVRRGLVLLRNSSVVITSVRRAACYRAFAFLPLAYCRANCFKQKARTIYITGGGWCYRADAPSKIRISKIRNGDRGVGTGVEGKFLATRHPSLFRYLSRR